VDELLRRRKGGGTSCWRRGRGTSAWWKRSRGMS